MPIREADVTSRAALGRWAEEFVYRLLLARAEPGSKVTWVNEHQEGGKPYDVLVRGPGGEVHAFVEVKATGSEDKCYFEVSHNEWLFAQQEGDRFQILRVFGAAGGQPRVARVANPYLQWRSRKVGVCLVL
jgi:hypothetical protein